MLKENKNTVVISHSSDTMVTKNILHPIKISEDFSAKEEFYEYIEDLIVELSCMAIQLGNHSLARLLNRTLQETRISKIKLVAGGEPSAA